MFPIFLPLKASTWHNAACTYIKHRTHQKSVVTLKNAVSAQRTLWQCFVRTIRVLNDLSSSFRFLFYNRVLHKNLNLLLRGDRIIVPSVLFWSCLTVTRFRERNFFSKVTVTETISILAAHKSSPRDSSSFLFTYILSNEQATEMIIINLGPD